MSNCCWNGRRRPNLVAHSTLPHLWTRISRLAANCETLAPIGKTWADLGQRRRLSRGGLMGLRVEESSGSRGHIVEAQRQEGRFLREYFAALPNTPRPQFPWLDIGGASVVEFGNAIDLRHRQCLGLRTSPHRLRRSSG